MTITWKGSPNFDTNRQPIDRIVCHWFGAGTLQGAHNTFQKIGGTSAHYGISDNTVWQWVREEHVAYHAGSYPMNQRSIGIEHDANPDRPLSEASYQTSAELIAQICKRYNIPIDRNHIIKHSEVPRATACPGTIDIDRLVTLAKLKAGIIEQPSMDELLTYLGTQSVADAKVRLTEHLGQKDNKCNWGAEPGFNQPNTGGHLGSARRELSEVRSKLVLADTEIAQLKAEVARLNAIISQPTPSPTEPGFRITGKKVTTVEGNKTTEISYGVI